jgi:hypothetical protein
MRTRPAPPAKAHSIWAKTLPPRLSSRKNLVVACPCRGRDVCGRRNTRDISVCRVVEVVKNKADLGEIRCSPGASHVCIVGHASCGAGAHGRTRQGQLERARGGEGPGGGNAGMGSGRGVAREVGWAWSGSTGGKEGAGTGTESAQRHSAHGMHG